MDFSFGNILERSWMKNTRIKEIIIKEVSTTNTDERFMKQILLETLYEILESKQKGESV
jgi:hypothetical protein